MMLSDNTGIKDIMYGSVIEKLSSMKGITLAESRSEIAKMSFSEYLSLLEASADITPPSGNKIAPSSAPSSTSAPQQQNKTQPPGAAANIKSLWPGNGAPVKAGMTVGLKGVNGTPVPGEITQVDQSANGVKVKNPTTGQEEWHSNDDLQMYKANHTPLNSQAGKGGFNLDQLSQMEEASALSRLKYLAGIAEDASCGATASGAIATAPAATGTMRRRQPVEETQPKEYTPKGPAKTIVGDTKPGQAMGELSSNLAVKGKKTATRKNNGFKK